MLHVNLSHITLLQYGLDKSKAEIEKLNLTATIEQANRTMKTNILEALEFLKQYGATYEDLQDMVKKNLKNNDLQTTWTPFFYRTKSSIFTELN